VDSLERRLRAAETKFALARLADRLGIMERTVRDALTAHTEDFGALAETAHETAMDQEELRIRELYRLSGDAEMEEDLRRLREDPP
jgi:hypothetical protein